MEIQQAHSITGNRAIRSSILHFDTVPQHFVKRSVVTDECGGIETQHLSQCFFLSFLRDQRIQPMNRVSQSPDQHDIPKRGTLRPRFTWSNLRPMPVRKAQLSEPVQSCIFDNGFIE